MNRGLFQAQINEAFKILKILELLEDFNPSPSYPRGLASDFRRSDYSEIWIRCFKDHLYHFQLSDNSLIQFICESFSPLRLRYAYYECPFNSLAYADFLSEIFGYNYLEVGEAFRPDYEEYISTAQYKDYVTPLRYDFNPEYYREGIHPASHFHFGYNTNIRVASTKVLKPLSFLLFIIRQYYPLSWAKLLPLSKAANWCKNVKINLDDIDYAYWNKYDQWEMVLS